MKKNITNREALEQMDTHELAGILCDNVFLSCKNCPGENMCFSGEHANGLEKWLNTETEDGFICWDD